MTARPWCACNMTTRPRKASRWMAKCNYCIQERIGAAWFYGIAPILKIKYSRQNCLIKNQENSCTGLVGWRIPKLVLSLTCIIGWWVGTRNLEMALQRYCITPRAVRGLKITGTANIVTSGRKN